MPVELCSQNGPEAGGGPVCDLEVGTDTFSAPNAGEALFESLALEPYETVFADPPEDDLHGQTNSTVRSSETSQESYSDVQFVEQSFLIRNLDTGTVRRLGGDALNMSFIGELPDARNILDGCARPWESWWSEKRRQDEWLWSASESGSLKVLREALAQPTSDSGPRAVNARSLYGRTALHMASFIGKADCLEALLDAGADVDALTDAGFTALHIVSQRGHLQATRLLLDWGSDAFLADNEGNLSLHLAAANGHTDVVTLLLEQRGAGQLCVRNNLGQRPGEVALDIHTATLLKRFSDSSGRHESCTSQGSSGEDHYAGRTPFYETEEQSHGILLPNSRRDVVRRILDRTQNPPASSSIGPSPPPVSPSATERGREAHGPFVKVNDSATVERVGPNSFELLKQLGKGSFGEVFKVLHKQTQLVYAMKVLRKEKIMNANLLPYAMTERNVLSFMKHPYIVSLHYAFQTQSHLVLVLKFGSMGSLQRLIDSEKKLQEPLARLYSAEVLLALGHLHERQIIFRDLKPDNVVISEYGHTMLTDFGLSKQGVAGLHGTRSFCGSVAFFAPEILTRSGHGHTVDIYGLGVILFDMLTGLPPYYHPDRETLFTNIKYARLRIPDYVSRHASQLIQALMQREPSQRLGATHTSDVQHHPFYQSIDWSKMMRQEVPVPAPYDASFSLWRSERSSSGFRSGREPRKSPFGDQVRSNGWRGNGPRSTGSNALGRAVSGWEFASASLAHAA